MSWGADVEIWPNESILYVPALPGFQVNAASPPEALTEAEQRVEALRPVAPRGRAAAG